MDAICYPPPPFRRSTDRLFIYFHFSVSPFANVLVPRTWSRPPRDLSSQIFGRTNREKKLSLLLFTIIVVGFLSGPGRPDVKCLDTLVETIRKPFIRSFIPKPKLYYSNTHQRSDSVSGGVSGEFCYRTVRYSFVHNFVGHSTPIDLERNITVILELGKQARKNILSVRKTANSFFKYVYESYSQIWMLFCEIGSIQ